MSPSVFIVVRRRLADGSWVSSKAPRGTDVRYVVRYRLGGRGAGLQHGGTFRTRRDAQERARHIAGALAARTVHELAEVSVAPGTAVLSERTVAEEAARFAASRIDVGARTQALYRQALLRLGALGRMDPAKVTPQDVQEWVAAQSDLAPSSIALYLGVIRQVFDHAELERNPARSRKVRVPARQEEEIEPPTLEHFLAMLGAISPRHRLHLLLIEGTGLRIGEVEALRWGDVDLPGRRLRVARGRTKGRGSGRRFVPIEPELVATLSDLRPRKDRERASPLFPDFSAQGLRLAMERACRAAGIPHYHPHDLRHRYISLLVAAGLPIPLVQRVVGHSRASTTLDTYSHVLLDEPAERLAQLRRGVFWCASGAPIVE